MNDLRNALSRFIDNGARQALSMLNEAQRAFDNFDFDASIDSIMETGKGAYNGFNEFMKTIKDSVSDFKIVIPFNEKKEKFDINVEDNVITVTVNGKGTHRETKATIPSNCIIDKLERFVDKKKGNLIVVIPKNISEDEGLKKIKENVSEKVNKTASWLKDALKERAEKVAASTVSPSPKKHQKTRKFVRGADGKFRATKKGSK